MVSFAELKQTRPDVFAVDCPVRTVLDHVMSRWGVLLLFALADGTKRWGELRRDVDGISEKMLAVTLRTLTDDGFVRRESFPTVPPKVEYSLTPRGDEFMTHMLPLLGWVAENAEAITAGDDETAAPRDIAPHLLDERTGS